MAYPLEQPVRSATQPVRPGVASGRRFGAGVRGALAVSAVLCLLLVLMRPQALMPQDAFAISADHRLQPPGPAFVLGTDHLGRDLLSRIILGTRPSVLVSSGVVLLATTAGLMTGMVAAFYRRLDNLIMRIMDGMMAFPAIMLALAILAIMGRSVVNLILAVAIVYTPQIARVSRSLVLAYREADFVSAAVATGASGLSVMWRHLLPNVIPGVMVQATYFFARALLTEASLSFLGLGLPPDVPSWGMVLGEGRRFLREAPWTTIFPGLAIAGTVVIVNVLGDVVRDRLDPRLKGIEG